MRIGIDCRLYGPKHTGIGRYVQNLIENLLLFDKENEYVLFTRNEIEQEVKNLKLDIKNSLKISESLISPLKVAQIKNLKLKIITADIPHYSLREQLGFPKIIKIEKVDLMHFPHFNVPVFYRGKYIVTIHDLIKHNSRGAATTTRSPLLYWLKYLGYRFVFSQAVKRASKIITPSRFVKEEIINEYKINPNKIMVTYEGVDDKLQMTNDKFQINTKYKILNTKYKIRKPYLLYVGSVYPHKNVGRLVEAIKSLQSTVYSLQLVIVCGRSIFSERLRKKMRGKLGGEMRTGEFVNLAGYVPDEELAVLYKEAEAFVFPTLSEGFGLPGLEAMSLGCPVLCSDIPVLHEVYKESALYFDPLNSSDIAEKIKNFLSDKNLQEILKKKGLELAKRYSWSKMAIETLQIYKQCR